MVRLNAQAIIKNLQNITMHDLEVTSAHGSAKEDGAVQISGLGPGPPARQGTTQWHRRTQRPPSGVAAGVVTVESRDGQ
jgi:hypothetical protein